MGERESSVGLTLFYFLGLVSFALGLDGVIVFLLGHCGGDVCVCCLSRCVGLGGSCGVAGMYLVSNGDGAKRWTRRIVAPQFNEWSFLERNDALVHGCQEHFSAVQGVAVENPVWQPLPAPF